jgi:hypothetical protein
MFYSAIRNNKTMWFEGKCIKLEDIMLSEGSERQRTCVFLSYVEDRFKRNIYTKTYMIIYKLFYM